MTMDATHWQKVRTLQYYEVLDKIRGKEWMVHRMDDISNKEVYRWSEKDLIEEVPNRMGKNTMWTTTQLTGEILDSIDYEEVLPLPDMYAPRMEYILEHDEVFDRLGEVREEDTFLASDAGLLANQPTALMDRGVLIREEQYLGYPDVYSLTHFGKVLVDL